MIPKRKHTGFAIAIAWPETWCKQSGAWWDGLLNRLGVSKNHYFKVGHAALVLVKPETGACHYYDFGRYHTPFKHGRVRSEKTDDGLKIKTRAKISPDGAKIENFDEILTELQMNPECHGEGSLHASYGKINFEKAVSRANQMQEQSPIPYGPFMFKGSNCSRFVNTVIRVGSPHFLSFIKLNYLVPLTPTTLNNVNSFDNKTVLGKLLPIPAFVPAPIRDKSLLGKTLPTPPRPEKVPETAQWLSGEGAGSWFNIVAKGGGFFITRFGPDGVTECESEFILMKGQKFDLNGSYQFDYLSHCDMVVIRQHGERIEFHRKRKEKNILEEENSKGQKKYLGTDTSVAV